MEIVIVKPTEILDDMWVVKVPEDLWLSREPRFGLLVVGIGNDREDLHRKVSARVFVKCGVNIGIGANPDQADVREI
jgi:hypothetical protein